MNEILAFAQSASPLGVIALLVIVIFQLVGGKNVIDKIRGVQKDKAELLDEKIVTLESLNRKISTIANNHLHELPEMKKTIDKIATDVSFIKDNYGNRLTAVETEIKYKT